MTFCYVVKKVDKNSYKKCHISSRLRSAHSRMHAGCITHAHMEMLDLGVEAEQNTVQYDSGTQNTHCYDLVDRSYDIIEQWFSQF